MRRFLYRLALAMGCVDPDAMAATMTSGQLAEWAAYYGLEPWGAEPWVEPEPVPMGKLLRSVFTANGTLPQERGEDEPV